MEPGVRYQIKHSGEFLYKISNEEDKLNFKVYKIRIPSPIQHIADNESSKVVTEDPQKQ